jgi:hypothetical protein
MIFIHSNKEVEADLHELLDVFDSDTEMIREAKHINRQASFSVEAFERVLDEMMCKKR